MALELFQFNLAAVFTLVNFAKYLGKGARCGAVNQGKKRTGVIYYEVTCKCIRAPADAFGRMCCPVSSGTRGCCSNYPGVRCASRSRPWEGRSKYVRFSLKKRCFVRRGQYESRKTKVGHLRKVEVESRKTSCEDFAKVESGPLKAPRAASATGNPGQEARPYPTAVNKSGADGDTFRERHP